VKAEEIKRLKIEWWRIKREGSEAHRKGRLVSALRLANSARILRLRIEVLENQEKADEIPQSPSGAMPPGWMNLGMQKNPQQTPA
jgi:hypothetical protein